MLMRVFLGWLRGERGHCGMVVIPTMEEEAARRRAANARTWSTSAHALPTA
jgi:hypothetical protein